MAAKIKQCVQAGYTRALILINGAAKVMMGHCDGDGGGGSGHCS